MCLRPYLRLIVICLIISSFLGLGYNHLSRAAKRGYSDFHCYYVAGERMLRGEEIYIAHDPDAAEFRYAPLFAVLMSGMSLLKEKYADLGWFIFNLLLFSFSFLMLKGIFKRAMWFLVLLGVVRLFLHNLNTGQANILMMSGIVLAIYYLAQKKDGLGGLALGFAVTIKFTPLVFLPYFIFRRKFKAALALILGVIGFLLLPALAVGLKNNFRYLQSFIPYLGQSTIFEKSTLLDPQNQSLLSFIYRLFTNCRLEFHAPYMPFQAWGLSDRWIYAIFIVFSALLYLLIFLKRKMPDTLDYAMLSICVALFNFNAWMHHFILLLIPYFFILDHLAKNAYRDKLALYFLALSYCLNIFTVEALLGDKISYKLGFYSPFTLSALLAFLALARIKFTGHYEEKLPG